MIPNTSTTPANPAPTGKQRADDKPLAETISSLKRSKSVPAKKRDDDDAPSSTLIAKPKAKAKAKAKPKIVEDDDDAPISTLAKSKGVPIRTGQRSIAKSKQRVKSKKREEAEDNAPLVKPKIIEETLQAPPKKMVKNKILKNSQAKDAAGNILRAADKAARAKKKVPDIPADIQKFELNTPPRSPRGKRLNNTPAIPKRQRVR